MCVLFLKTLLKSPLYSFVFFKNGERKPNIFLVLRIKRLSVYPEIHSIVVGACVQYFGYEAEEWRAIWGEQLLWLRFFCCGWGVKPLGQPQYTLDTNLWQLFPERTCWWLHGLIVPTRLVSTLNWREVYWKNLTYYCKKICHEELSHVSLSNKWQKIFWSKKCIAVWFLGLFTLGKKMQFQSFYFKI